MSIEATSFSIGQRVRYVPGHAHNDQKHPDCEDGTKARP